MGIAVIDTNGVAMCLCWAPADAEKLMQHLNQLLRDVRVLGAEVRQHRKVPFDRTTDSEAQEKLNMDREVAWDATDNSGALTRWGEVRDEERQARGGD